MQYTKETQTFLFNEKAGLKFHSKLFVLITLLFSLQCIMYVILSLVNLSVVFTKNKKKKVISNNNKNEKLGKLTNLFKVFYSANKHITTYNVGQNKSKVPEKTVLALNKC